MMKTVAAFAHICLLLWPFHAAQADLADAVKSPKGYGSKGYVWGKLLPEQIEVLRSEGLTLIVVSHDLMVVRHLCDQLVVMRAGRIVEQGPTAQVYEHPATDYTRALLDAVPKIRVGG